MVSGLMKLTARVAQACAESSECLASRDLRGKSARDVPLHARIDERIELGVDVVVNRRRRAKGEAKEAANTRSVEAHHVRYALRAVRTVVRASK